MLAFLARPLVFAAFLLTAIPVTADCLCDFMNDVARDTKRRNCWPAPFVCPDRQMSRLPFAVMVENGWRRQNMLGDFYFEQSSGKLTEAGELKIRWIVYEAPVQHRSIFVHIAKTPEETAFRMASVQEYTAKLVPNGELPPIAQTSIPDAGSPADRIQMIDRKYRETTPAPRLPEDSNQGSGSSSGSTPSP